MFNLRKSDEDTTRGDRLKFVRQHFCLTQEEFAERIQTSRATISRIEKNYQEIPEVVALAAEYKFGVAFRWLVSGEGPMWIEAGSQIERPTATSLIARPLLVGSASCGPGGEIQDPGPNAQRFTVHKDHAERIFSHCGGGQPEDLFFLICHGDSMAPTIQDNEVVLLNAAISIRMMPKNNAIYLVRRSPSDPEARVKRLLVNSDAHQMVLGSDNRKYRDIAIPLDGVPLHQLILGRVVWVGRDLLDTDPPPEDW